MRVYCEFMARYLVRYEGTFSTGSWAEIFLHTLCVNSTAAAEDVALALGGHFSGLWADATVGVGGLHTPSVIYKQVSVAEIINLELGTVSAAYHAQLGAGLVGSATGNTMPPQVALAVSLTAGTYANGRPMRGRFYLPAMAVSNTTTDGQCLTTTRDRVAEFWKRQWELMEQDGHILSVWSRSAPKSGGGTTTQTVEQLRVGNRFDTIRTRRNATPETYFAPVSTVTIERR